MGRLHMSEWVKYPRVGRKIQNKQTKNFYTTVIWNQTTLHTYDCNMN